MYDKVPLSEVANSERTFRKDWIAKSGYDVTDDFIRYAKPLVGEDMISLPMIDGRQRLARFEADSRDPEAGEAVRSAGGSEVGARIWDLGTREDR